MCALCAYETDKLKYDRVRATLGEEDCMSITRQ